MNPRPSIDVRNVSFNSYPDHPSGSADVNKNFLSNSPGPEMLYVQTPGDWPGMGPGMVRVIIERDITVVNQVSVL